MALDDADNREVTAAGARKVRALGRYRLVAELARGGMGVVYLALVRGPAGFHKLFVVKELKAHLAEDPHLVSMFLEEARLSAKLSHPNIVQTIEVGSEGERHFMVMEYLEGQPLHRVLARSRKAGTKLPLHYTLSIFSAALEGLHYAHTLADFDGTPLRLVHRDVSPHNVFVTYDGQTKVLDFGIAKALDSANETRTGILKGKVAYMSPEQAAGQAADARVDVFAAGVMLWEAVSGKRMWKGVENDMQILHALMKGAIPSIREAAPDTPEELARIVSRATAAQAEGRYASAAELQSDLDAYLKTLAVPPFAARDVGKLVSDLFAPERAQLKAVVDEQLRMLRTMASGEYGAVEMPALGGPSSTRGTPSGIAAIRPPSSGSMRIAFTGSGPHSGFSEAPAGPAASAMLAPAAAAAPKRRTGLLVGIAAIVAVASSAAIVVSLRPPAAVAPRAASSAATPPIATAIEPPSPAAPVHVTVLATPADAQITIDGALVGRSGTVSTFPRDGAKHTVVVEAKGYRSKSETFAANADLQIAVDLVAQFGGGGGARAVAVRPSPPVEAPVAPATTAEPPPPPATTAPIAAPPPGARAPRPIDTSNPYAH